MALRHKLRSRLVREVPSLAGRGDADVRMRRPVSFGPHVPQLIRLVRTPFRLDPGRSSSLDLGERGVEPRPSPESPPPPFARRRLREARERTADIDAALGVFP